jgi:hypothetical protein
MNGDGNQELVPVLSHDELQAGMTLVEKHSGGAHAFVVLRVGIDESDPVHPDGTPCPTNRCFLDTDSRDDDDWCCYCNLIDEGILYRLSDLDPADEVSRRRCDTIDDYNRRVHRQLVAWAAKESRP